MATGATSHGNRGSLPLNAAGERRPQPVGHPDTPRGPATRMWRHPTVVRLRDQDWIITPHPRRWSILPPWAIAAGELKLVWVCESLPAQMPQEHPPARNTCRTEETLRAERRRGDSFPEPRMGQSGSRVRGEGVPARPAAAVKKERWGTALF